MTNKSKKQVNKYPFNRDTQMFQKSEETFYSLKTAFSALNCCEPEPLYIHGRYWYL
jgi:hypothetical protein